jgi:hypothetical protein
MSYAFNAAPPQRFAPDHHSGIKGREVDRPHRCVALQHYSWLLALLSVLKLSKTEGSRMKKIVLGLSALTLLGLAACDAVGKGKAPPPVAAPIVRKG